MIGLYILLVILAFYGLSINRFNEDYIGKNQSNAIKGLCIILVFARHIWPYIKRTGFEPTTLGDRLFFQIDRSLGQLLVVMFLFYSGYGVMESIRKKGLTYIVSFPKNRILPTLLNFDVAVLFFIIMDFLLGIDLTWYNSLLAFTGWTSVGNSNWYIFIIILCYFFTWVAYRFRRPNYVFLLIAFLYIILIFTKRPYWYNTMVAYAVGMLYSQHKTVIEKWVKDNYWRALIGSISFFAVFYFFPLSFFGIIESLRAIFIAVIVVLVSMKVYVGNKVTIWLGKKLFPLYIYQRIPMIFFIHFLGQQFVCEHAYVYVTICMIVTVIFGIVYRPVSFNIFRK